MIKEHGVNPADFHIVAHSLGAAVAGYAGHRISGLGRITGLDPASPFFENTDPIVRLDPSDAKFVDIIHTDGSPTLLLGFGQILLTFTGSQTTQSVLLDSDETFLKRNGIETRYIPLTTDLGMIQHVNVKFERAGHLISSLIYSSKWTFTNVTVIDGDRQISVTFCPKNDAMVLESGGSTARFYPC
ncbi:unnamed protein product [Rotaria sp. Silwood1]|nr:unnamed protein product [Rotaria sp. Silwood1]